jgi:hypothetical protein
MKIQIIQEAQYSEKTGRKIEPAVGRCVCGEAVALEHFTNTCCRCGRDYNMSGALLAPRSQWGCETGEHWTDCI